MFAHAAGKARTDHLSLPTAQTCLSCMMGSRVSGGREQGARVGRRRGERTSLERGRAGCGRSGRFPLLGHYKNSRLEKAKRKAGTGSGGGAAAERGKTKDAGRVAASSGVGDAAPWLWGAGKGKKGREEGEGGKERQARGRGGRTLGLSTVEVLKRPCEEARVGFGLGCYGTWRASSPNHSASLVPAPPPTKSATREAPSRPHMSCSHSGQSSPPPSILPLFRARTHAAQLCLTPPHPLSLASVVGPDTGERGSSESARAERVSPALLSVGG